MDKEDFIKVADDYPTYSVNHFTVPSQYKEYIETVVFPHGLILNRVERLALQIHEDYKEKDSITLLCVLKGAFRVCQDLMTFISGFNKTGSPDKSVKVYIEFIRARSYLNECQGDINITTTSTLDINDKNVIIVEDIIDTGRTMEKLLEKIRTEYTPKSLKVLSLMLKRKKMNSTGFRPDYLGFEIPDIWITGYGGFDYNESFRDLDHIVVLNERGCEKYRV